MSGLPLGPYTVKNLSAVMFMLYRWWYVWQISSPARFVAAYGDIGFRQRSVSLNGACVWFPYTLLLLANMKSFIWFFLAFSRRFVVPFRFVSM